MKVCKNPWKTVISAVNSETQRFEKIKIHVGKAVDNMNLDKDKEKDTKKT